LCCPSKLPHHGTVISAYVIFKSRAGVVSRRLQQSTGPAGIITGEPEAQVDDAGGLKRIWTGRLCKC
jgi:hypothetical protein